MTSERFMQIEERSQETLATLSAHIGDLARSFSLLEEEVVYLFSLLVNHANPEIGRILAQRLNYARLVDMIADLSKERVNEKTQSALAPYIARLRDVGRIRNTSIHSAWGYLMNDDHTLCQWSATGRLRGELRHNADNILHRLASESAQVGALAEELGAFVSKNIWVKNSQHHPEPYTVTAARTRAPPLGQALGV